MKAVAFVCKGNSFKSIICERFLKELTNNFIIVSAGTNPACEVNIDGAKIMKEKGLSLSGYKPHSLEDLPEEIDYLVTMGCETECPFVPAKEIINFNMDAYSSNTFEEKEIVVNMLEEKVKQFFESIS